MPTPISRKGAADTLAAAIKRAGLNAANLTSVRRWLQEQLSAHEYAKLGQGGHTNTQVPLKRVFIDLPVGSSPRAEDGSRQPFLRNLLAAKPVELNARLGTDRLFDPSENPSENLDATTRRAIRHAARDAATFGASLLVGGPGQGKSTLGQLACQIHRAHLLLPMTDKLSTASKELVDSFCSVDPNDETSAGDWCRPATLMLPLQVSLPDLAVWLNHDAHIKLHPPAILRFIAELDSARESELSAHVIAALAINIPILLFLDGFDEVGAVQDRERLVLAANELLAFLGHHRSRAQIVATTRPQGYSDEFAKIGVELSTCYLLPLEREEALKYAEKLVHEKIQGADERKQTLDRLREAAAEPATERLLITPLQVTILAALVQHRGRAPRERWNLFHGYFNFTYAREIERNSYASELLRDYKHHIEQIHARVGLLLQVEAERDGGASARLSRSRLEEIIEAVLSDAGYSDDSERAVLVADIVEAAKLRLVFLVEPEPGAFGFEIRSFQEFMCAWALTTGREQHVEDRIAVIARAPMFRNVSLFVASRLFGEGSHLCDLFVRRICHAMDNSPDDLPGSITKSGGGLALEILDEGAALSYPKHARELIIRACSLFHTAPSPEHIKLAHCASPEIRKSIGSVIEEEFLAERSTKKYNQLSIWVCLIELVNNGDLWAVLLADRYWHLLPDYRSVLYECTVLNVGAGKWLRDKLIQNSIEVSPESFIDLRPTKHGAVGDWVEFLTAMFEIGTRWRHTPTTFNGFLIRDSREDAVEVIASLGPVPKGWESWCAAATYEFSPSLSSLATALDAIAPRPTAAVQIEARSSWPLAACLRFKDDLTLLHEAADYVRLGQLGTVNDWRQAQGRWLKKPSRKIIPNGSQILPWDNSSVAAPIELSPWWDVVDHKDRSVEKILHPASKLFNSTTSRHMKRWSAKVCLATLSSTTNVNDPQFDIRGWVAAEPSFVGALLPRPLGMSRVLWVEILREVPNHTRPTYIGDFDHLFDSSKLDDFIPEAVDLFVRSISNHYGKPIELDQNIISLMIMHLPANFLESGSGLILKALTGTLVESDDDLLVEKICSLGLSTRPIYLEACAHALDIGSLPPHRVVRILVAILKSIGIDDPSAHSMFTALRKISQLHTTRMENAGIWDRLGLFLPRPDEKDRVTNQGVITGAVINIISVELKNLAGIERLTITPRPSKSELGQWTLIIGANGVGKTTVLRALALALRNAEDPTIWPNRSLSLPWIRRPRGQNELAEEASIRVLLDTGGSYRTRIRSSESTTFLRDIENGPLSVLVFAYGCRRGSTYGGTTGRINLSEKDGVEIASLFDDGAGLIDVESWLIQLDGDSNKASSSKTFFDAVVDALCILLQVQKIFVRELTVWVSQEGKPTLPLTALSDGYLVNAGWFIDLIARWSDLAKKQNLILNQDFLSQMTGLVLIDEIDIHLHPQWQLEIVGRTRSLLPRMSFVVTTHNPLTLVGAKADEIWVIDDSAGVHTGRVGIANPAISTGSQIYNEYFGISDFYPKAAGEKVHRYSFLSRFGLRDDDEEIELLSLSAELSELGILPSWPISPRIARKQYDKN